MNLTPNILNVIRVSLDRADMNHRATGFKPFEIEAAKAWVKSAAIGNTKRSSKKPRPLAQQGAQNG